KLRIFQNDDGKFDRSLLDTGGAALVVSQFTLIADTAKGNRPSFSGAARPELAEPLYERFAEALRGLGVPVETGVFGARMAFERAVGGTVRVKTETRRERGVVVSAGERAVRIENGAGPVDISYDEIVRANLIDEGTKG